MAEAAAPAKESKGKVFSLEECEKHTTDEDCWLVIHGKVYDVTAMLDEHPGGGDILVSAAGRDATDDFEDVGHSSSAREWLEKHYIGEFEGGDASASKKTKKGSSSSSGSDSGASKAFKALLPLLIVILALLAAKFGFPTQQ